MAYSTDLADPISRVRFLVGDVLAVTLLPDATYAAVLLRATTGTPPITDEAAAGRDIARALAARYAIEPDSISDDGTSARWGERVKQWNLIALGQAGGAATRTAATGTAKGITIRRGPARDYTTGGGDGN